MMQMLDSIKSCISNRLQLKFFKRLLGFHVDNGIHIINVSNTLVKSYGQYGEDLVVDGIIGNKETGFFIDIGANDPTILSNTKRFYDRGWSGINIEPNPILFKKLVSQRPRDINLNLGVGPFQQELPFYILSADTLSTFIKKDSDRNCEIYKEKIIDVKKIQMLPLVEILEKYAGNTDIDFISVDVEGYELEVLQSNNWERFRPHIILIEINNNTSEIIGYLEKICCYSLVFQNGTNGIFLDTKKLDQ